MATVTINSITCVKLEDRIGPDEIEVYVDGLLAAAGLVVRKAKTVTIGTTRSFTDSARVELYELDPGRRTKLGTVTVKEAEAGLGTQAGIFDDVDGAHYTTSYYVTA